MINFQPYYYRTGAGAEIDLINECSEGFLPNRSMDEIYEHLEILLKKETVCLVGSYTTKKELYGWMVKY